MMRTDAPKPEQLELLRAFRSLDDAARRCILSAMKQRIIREKKGTQS
jgi:hypothetical protein